MTVGMFASEFQRRARAVLEAKTGQRTDPDRPVVVEYRCIANADEGTDQYIELSGLAADGSSTVLYEYEHGDLAPLEALLADLDAVPDEAP